MKGPSASAVKLSHALAVLQSSSASSTVMFSDLEMREAVPCNWSLRGTSLAAAAAGEASCRPTTGEEPRLRPCSPAAAGLSVSRDFSCRKSRRLPKPKDSVGVTLCLPSAPAGAKPPNIARSQMGRGFACCSGGAPSGSGGAGGGAVERGVCCGCAGARV